MDKFGLTEERYRQMMKEYDNDESIVEEIVNDWGVDCCNKGYDTFDYNCTGLLCIEAVYDVGAFETDEEAVKKAISDGIKIIPVEELPENMPENMVFYGWIDTADNRKRIADYCND